MIYDIFGNEFIFIENRFHPEDGFSFNLKILDAINSIRNGYADCIVRTKIGTDLTKSYSPIDLYDYYLNPFIDHINVILYKDRAVGDNIRKNFLQAIEQQGEIIYKYTIICIHQPDKTYSVDYDENRLIYFSSEEEAKEFLNEYANMLFSYFINTYQKKLKAIKQFPELNINLSETDRLIFFFTKDLDYSFEPTVDFFKNKFQIVQMIKKEIN